MIVQVTIVEGRIGVVNVKFVAEIILEQCNKGADEPLNQNHKWFSSVGSQVTDVITVQYTVQQPEH